MEVTHAFRNFFQCFVISLFLFFFSLDCGGVIHGNKGSINFINHKSSTSYKNNRICSWILKPDSNLRAEQISKIKTMIIFHEFDLEYTEKCDHDFVRIYNFYDNTKGFKEADKFCQKKDNFIELDYTATMAVQFISDPDETGKGFQLSFIRTMKGKKKSESFHPAAFKRYGQYDILITICISAIVTNCINFSHDGPAKPSSHGSEIKACRDQNNLIHSPGLNNRQCCNFIQHFAVLFDILNKRRPLIWRLPRAWERRGFVECDIWML